MPDDLAAHARDADLAMLVSVVERLMNRVESLERRLAPVIEALNEREAQLAQLEAELEGGADVAAA
jgi:hypothetical protein